MMGERGAKRIGPPIPADRAVLAVLASCLAVVLTACAAVDGGRDGPGGQDGEGPSPAGGPVSGAEIPSDARGADPADPADPADTILRVVLYGPADDDPRDRIAQGIRSRLDEIGAERDAVFEVVFQDLGDGADPSADPIADPISGDADLMIGVTASSADILRAAADRGIPAVFAAVPDPEGAGLTASDGTLLPGTSDRPDAAGIMDLIFAADPEASRIGILYDRGRSSSAASVSDAVARLAGRGVEIVERTGATEDEIVLAARALVGDGVDAVFTPMDDTVLRAEPAVCGIFTEAGIPHYGGADAFARRGAFLGIGVDYAELGAETADIAAEILLDGADPSSIPVRVLTGDTAAVSAETCAALGWDLETVRAALGPLCSELETVMADEGPADVQGVQGVQDVQDVQDVRDEIPADHADPQDGDPQDGDPQDADPQDGDPQDGDPQDADPQDADPQDADPQDADPQDADPQDGVSPSLSRSGAGRRAS